MRVPRQLQVHVGIRCFAEEVRVMAEQNRSFAFAAPVERGIEIRVTLGQVIDST